MLLSIKSTDQLTHMDGVPVRVWEGITGSGIPCKVFIHRIAVHNEQDSTELERELSEQLPPGRVVPLSYIL